VSARARRRAARFWLAALLAAELRSPAAAPVDGGRRVWRPPHCYAPPPSPLPLSLQLLATFQCDICTPELVPTAPAEPAAAVAAAVLRSRFVSLDSRFFSFVFAHGVSDRFIMRFASQLFARGVSDAARASSGTATGC